MMRRQQNLYSLLILLFHPRLCSLPVDLLKTEISKKYSYKLVFKFLSKYKKVRVTEKGIWESGTMLKYIEEIVQNLGV